VQIVIVGGGTAGWLAALMIKKVYGDLHNITLIESKNIGIIGAGEGSTGYLTDIIQGNAWDYGCNEGDFFKETGATVKLGIKHKEWKKLGHTYIAPLDSPRLVNEKTDCSLSYAILKDYPFHLTSQNGFYIENNLSSFFEKDGKIENVKSHAYHFDGHRVGQYFKKVCGDSVSLIDDKVVDLELNQYGFIDYLILESGRKIQGDFFVDASGFNRIFSKKLNVAWKSYQDNLTVNTAMPFLLEHEEGKEIEPVTTSWAQKAGWMWMIPTQDRYGCGYVFDNNFISNEEAQKEIESKINKKINPIKFISFEAGRLEDAWKNNCLFIGLSSAFAEPLEATSIHSTIIQLKCFIFDFLKETTDETCNKGNTEIYNKKISKMYDDYKDFINIHYASEREDSEFWRFLKTGETLTERSKELLSIQKSRFLRRADFEEYEGYAGAPLYNWIMAGLGIIDKNLAKKEMELFKQESLSERQWTANLYEWKKIKKTMIKNDDFIKDLSTFF
jgi:hypothetical protein